MLHIPANNVYLSPASKIQMEKFLCAHALVSHTSIKVISMKEILISITPQEIFLSLKFY